MAAKVSNDQKRMKDTLWAILSVFEDSMRQSNRLPLRPSFVHLYALEFACRRFQRTPQVMSMMGVTPATLIFNCTLAQALRLCYGFLGNLQVVHDRKCVNGYLSFVLGIISPKVLQSAPQKLDIFSSP